MLAQKQPSADVSDPIEAALAYHNGDVRATISTLLADCGHLRDQLSVATGCISKGLTRGWTPELERKI
ncbi:dehydrogenase [Rhizobium sp. Root1204]|nr:CUE domain-containing protein [Rhizobium sp. Root1204]KQV36330.1 dehydrogenase [Rhizobium sp. Root1204]